jgi:phosphatidylserine synthase
MWLKQYKKNFVGMQTVVALITVAAYFALYHRAWEPTMSFFFVLQGATFAGALWASRIKRRVDPHAR